MLVGAVSPSRRARVSRPMGVFGAFSVSVFGMKPTSTRSSFFTRAGSTHSAISTVFSPTLAGVLFGGPRGDEFIERGSFVPLLS